MKRIINRILSVLLCAALIILSLPANGIYTGKSSALESYVATNVWADVMTDGEFTGEFVYGDIVAVSSSEELTFLSEYVMSGKNTDGVMFYQTNDIRMNSDAADSNGDEIFGEFIPWTPIGSEEYPFRGSYDGCNFRIRGLFLYDSYMSFGGLFGYAVGCVLSNIVLTNSHVLAYSDVGGIIGRLEHGRIENCVCDSCYVGGQLLFHGGSEFIGGIAGSVYEGSIADSSFSGKLEGGNYIGGIVGFIQNDDTGVGVTGCKVSGSVRSGFTYGEVGGIVGYAFSNSLDGNLDITVYACTNEANVYCPDGDASSVAAGIVAYSRVQNDGDIIIFCCDNKGMIYSNEGTAAGIAGKLTVENPGTTFTVKRCYNVGEVSGEAKAMSISAVDDEQYAFDCYFLDTTGEDKYSAPATKSEFSDGYVCYMLNFKQDIVEFYQTLGFDEYPVTDASHSEVLYSAEEDKYENADHVPDTDADGYYIITTPWQFRWFANEVKSGAYNLNARLANDISFNQNVLDFDGNLNDDEYSKLERPIGFCMFNPDLTDYAYQGTFDGCGHCISGIYYDGDSYGSAGLFGYLGKNGVIKNLTLSDSYFSDRVFVGGLVGYNEGLIENCNVYANVECREYVAGVICGRNDGVIRNCTASGKVSGKNEIGGICGYMNAQIDKNPQTEISGCKSTATVLLSKTSYSCAGGVVGYIQNRGGSIIVERSFNSGEITSFTGDNNAIGGVIGQIATHQNGITSVKNCYSTGYMTVLMNEDYTSFGNCSGVVAQVEFYEDEDASSVNIENCFFDSGISVPENCYGVKSGILSAPVDERLFCLNDYYCFGESGDFGWGSNSTQASFDNGEICFWLNFGLEKPAFYQTIGKNGHPVLDSREGTVTYSYPEYYNELPVLEDGYYILEDVFDLYWFVGQVNKGNQFINARLANDIVINDSVYDKDGNVIIRETEFWWTPIGFRDFDDIYNSVCYMGTFDGNGHTISGIFYQDTYSPTSGGFIGYIGEGAVVRDLGITDSYFLFDGNFGAVVGYSYGTVSGCFVEAVISPLSGMATGGIVGINEGVVMNCVFNSDLFDGEAIGNDIGESKNTFGAVSTDFASGLVCFNINGMISDGNQTWYQEIGKDKLPKAKGKTVYCCSDVYSNSDIHKDSDADHYCDVCGRMMINWFNIEDYIVNGEKKAPSVRRKLFSGWFAKDSSFNRDTAVSEEMLSGMAAAKFVDENVLKADVVLLDYDETNKTASIRLSTTSDDLSYSKIGFVITTGERSTTKLTKSVYESINGMPENYLKTAFSDASEYLATYTITDIPESAFGQAITVTPVWITLDGTRVEGIPATVTVAELIK